MFTLLSCSLRAEAVPQLHFAIDRGRVETAAKHDGTNGYCLPQLYSNQIARLGVLMHRIMCDPVNCRRDLGMQCGCWFQQLLAQLVACW